MVYKECAFEIKMPNAFTPNGDYKNDIFRVPPQIYNRLIRFSVYNRWGQMMFTTTDMGKGWDGRFQGQPAPTGTYVYYVVMRSLDNRRDISSKGYVTLLR
jgi:gliding motility-associated-like protein